MKQIPSNLVQLIVWSYIKLISKIQTFPVPIPKLLQNLPAEDLSIKILNLEMGWILTLDWKQISSKRKAKEKALFLLLRAMVPWHTYKPES